MARRFRNYPIHEPMLLPEDLQDWLPENHLARFISETIELMDLSSFVREYETAHHRGQPPYHPAMMLKLWLYGYATKVNSSRKLERATYENVAFRFLAANLHPDHDSLAAFRVRHSVGMKAAFVEVLTYCRQMGLATLGAIAVDGSKIKANAALRNSIAHDDIDKKVEAQQRIFDELFAETELAEQADNDQDPHRLPKVLATAKERLARLKEIQKAVNAAKEAAKLEQKLNEEKLQADEDAQSDLDAKKARAIRELRIAKGFTQLELSQRTGIKNRTLSSYELGKRRIAAKHLLLLIRELGLEAAELLRDPDQANNPIKAPTSQATPRTNLTDNDSRVMKLRDCWSTIQGFNVQIAVDCDYQIIVAAEVVNNANDQGLLPGVIAQCQENTGQKLNVVLADSGYYSQSTMDDPLVQAVDLYAPPPRRNTNRNAATAAMRAKVATPTGKAFYRKRGYTVEPIFARVKTHLGFSSFRLRGLLKVNLEFNLLAIACNLMKLHLYGG